MAYLRLLPHRLLTMDLMPGPRLDQLHSISVVRFRYYPTPPSHAHLPEPPNLTKLIMLPGDTVTTPTASMLLATQNCTLQDDVFQEDPTTNSLEAYIADMTGKEAALFIISGSMGNQLSVRTALGGPPHSVLADARSHIIGW